MSEQQIDTQPRTCHTRDNVGVTANASVYWAIVDPERALYEVDVLPIALADITLNSLRSYVGSMQLDEVLTNRKQLNERVSADLIDTGQKWGIRISRVEIQELAVNDDTSRAMLQQMEAERKSRATVAEAEGQAKAIRMTAEAERDAAIEKARGEAEALALIAQAETAYLAQISQHLSEEKAAQLLTAQKVLAGYNTISKNPADKVFLPNHFSGVFTLPTNNNRTT
ncbi:band 7/Mec-2 family protein, putative [Luminiphilus syltensis NOR5-1B]|uniref:Band 7/Mec-2 family protein, putative n=2 Tax=Luminiphilus TaxID=1341118 RepID=B8KYK2_9GAMM|nr:band 7/Mec-2 family protein, putative [Luminiphilus syltensis NOR5-1B]